LDNSWE